jgi:hypothetical protein
MLRYFKTTLGDVSLKHQIPRGALSHDLPL